MTDDFETRIRDIRERIAELRNRLYPPRPEGLQGPKEVVQQKQDMEQTPEAKRNAELEAIKRKLMGAKK